MNKASSKLGVVIKKKQEGAKAVGRKAPRIKLSSTSVEPPQAHIYTHVAPLFPVVGVGVIGAQTMLMDHMWCIQLM